MNSRADVVYRREVDAKARADEKRRQVPWLQWSTDLIAMAACGIEPDIVAKYASRFCPVDAPMNRRVF